MWRIDSVRRPPERGTERAAGDRAGTSQSIGVFFIKVQQLSAKHLKMKDFSPFLQAFAQFPPQRTLKARKAPARKGR
ncbi:hypothetical protein [Rhizobium sp. C4]|uniref:hypothetical protein n=1 Tax=Rhizobium sp. C4 TaxID=1349800 RepID=UPI001E47BBDF|nr:hypothetical protein [Rhizobium sp. C4]MCD2175724.1 hypothetical protein [Rhizobium sp. C4]